MQRAAPLAAIGGTASTCCTVRAIELVGMLALGDIATKVNDAIAGDALERISEPSVPDRSSQSAAAGPAGGGTGANTPPRRR